MQAVLRGHDMNNKTQVEKHIYHVSAFAYARMHAHARARAHTHPGPFLHEVLNIIPS